MQNQTPVQKLRALFAAAFAARVSLPAPVCALPPVLTFRAGRNAEKRAAREGSFSRREMLLARRLRQRGAQS